jgi:hypothetical protein
MNKPYTEEIKNGIKYREFDSMIESDELVWHRDKKTREVTVLEGSGWYFQMDNEIPKEMKEGDVLLVPKMEYHRIYKAGDTPLKISIKENIVKTFSDFEEEKVYYEALKLFENKEYLQENIFKRLSSAVKKKLEFFKKVAEYANKDITELLPILKNKKVFEFFKKIKFSFEYLFKLIKRGYKLYGEVQKAIAQYIANSKVGRWTEEKLKDLTEFLDKHPKLKRAAGPLVAGMLLYIWLNMSFTGDFVFDFDFSDLFTALAGKFSLATLFAGEEGTRLLLLFTTGLAGLSFPWPGPTSFKLVTAVITGLSKLAFGR